jgi:hypothetical protein
MGDKYTMDNVEAAEAPAATNPRFVLPMHQLDTNPEQSKESTEAKSKVRAVFLKTESLI